ncbi:hypothetical protein M413DRAFT_439052 [Hebeloma cylindrosporum]|uniref:F-box domain-containing protein n=1 Tax=Hebeloma cylindrosporum TaxID=76867 RepID=A0A0C3D0I1_HEBCY|nr:hypothetical protein M413DRAFT_439052 [Hebeloma cylindrosporum h7]
MDILESTLDIPLEILELIIDEVAHRNDKETLKTISLSSRRFVDHCQKKLFHTIDLADKCIYGEDYYRRLHRILSQRPKFCSYVRDLRLVDSYVWDQSKDWVWLANEESICDVLGILPNLHSFSLTFKTGQPKWTSFNSYLRQALLDLAKRPSIVRYSLNRISDFTPSLLVTLLMVKNLELHDVQMNEVHLTSSLAVVQGIASTSIPRLESLVLRVPSASTVHIIHTILSLYPIPMLRSLHVVFVNDTDDALVTELWALLQWSAPSLTELQWRPSIRTNVLASRPPRPIDIGILCQLETLHFLVNFHALPVFTELLAMLAQVSSNTAFRALVIECQFLKVVELVACASDWLSLDTTLTRPVFNGLRSVVFYVRTRPVASMKASARAILLEQLPGARAKGVTLSFYTDLY